MNKENNTALIVIVAVLLFVVMGSFSMMGFGGYGYGMMGGYYGGFGGMWLFGWLFTGLIFIALILAIIWLVRQINSPEEKVRRQ